MANERRWSSVAQSFVADGTLQGKITVADVAGFYVKSKVRIISNTQQQTLLEVKRIDGTTDIYVGDPSKDINDRTDMSAFLLADSSSITLYEQLIPNIKNEDIQQSIYAREPIVALRNILVDKYGRYYDSSNPIPTSATFTGDLLVNLDALTPSTRPDPDNVLVAGSEDGTKTGIKHALKIGSDLKLEVKDVTANTVLSFISNQLANDTIKVDDDAAQTILNDILTKLNAGGIIIGTEDGTATGVQHVFVNNLKRMILDSKDRVRNVTYLDPTSRKNRRVEKFEFSSATFPGITLNRNFTYSLIGTEYVFINDNWILI